MRAARAALALLLATVLAGCCSTPPRVTSRRTPREGYEAFRGALARDEIDREFYSFTKGLQARLGVRSRGDWSDIRAVVLKRGHPLVKGIVCSEVASVHPGKSENAAVLDIKLPLGYEARVRMRRLAVLRVYVLEEGEDEATVWVDILLPDVVALPVPQGVLIELSPEQAREVEEYLRDLGKGDRIDSVETRWEWFLDDFDVGGQTPEAVQREAGKEGASP